MVLLKERIGKMLEYLKDQIYPEKMEIKNYKMIRTDEKFQDVAHLDTSSWEDFSHEQIWGGHREYYWFETFVTIPEKFDGKCVVYELFTGKEWDWMRQILSFLFSWTVCFVRVWMSITEK